MVEPSRTAMTKADLISVVAKRLDITQVQAGIIVEAALRSIVSALQSGQEVEIRGQPISVNADIELFATGDGCCYQLEQRARAKIPLIGARVEKFAVSQALEGCRAEMDYLEQALG